MDDRRAPRAEMIALGLQNDSLPAADLVSAAVDVRASWTRIITTTDSDAATLRDRIRSAHNAGLQVILTVGGIGTHERRPGVAATLRWIESLPKVERYTWTNEPDLAGVSACNYARGWKRLRRVLGRALLWGDFSPFAPFRVTAAARRCVRLPRVLDMALHPYRVTDPNTGGPAEGALGQLHARKGVRYWLTEYGQYGRAADDAGNAVQWRYDLRTATSLKARCLVAYTASGPTWDTHLGPLSTGTLRQR